MHTHTPHCPHADEEYTLSSAEALMAGTLALMTGFAQADGAHAQAMARKIAENIHQMSQLADLSVSMRHMLMHLLPRWQQAAASPAVSAANPLPERARWLSSPATLQ